MSLDRRTNKPNNSNGDQCKLLVEKWALKYAKYGGRSIYQLMCLILVLFYFKLIQNFMVLLIMLAQIIYVLSRYYFRNNYINIKSITFFFSNC